jgi:hypothetical protein
MGNHRLYPASENLEETRRKRVEATAALERVERAEIAVTQLQNLITEAQAALSDLRSNADFNLLLTKANNDDRAAFDSIAEFSQKPGPFHDLAVTTINRIVIEVDPLIFVRVDPEVPWNQLHIDPSKLSLQELQTLYKSVHRMYRPR